MTDLFANYPRTFVDGIEYAIDVETDANGVLSVAVFNVAMQERVVGVYFDHDSESAEVEGPDFNESAPYFQLRDWLPHNIAAWAINQIPGY